MTKPNRAKHGRFLSISLPLILLLLTGCIRITSDAPPTSAATAPPLAIAASATPLPEPTAVSAPTDPPATASPIPTSAPPTATAVSPTTTPATTATSQPMLARPAHTINVDLDYATRFLTVNQTVTVPNTSSDVWTELIFHVAASYWPGIFTLNNSELILNGAASPLTPDWDGTMLTLALPAPLPPGQTAVITFTYELNPPNLNPTGWGPYGNIGAAPNLIQLGDWYPALVPYLSGDGWQTWEFTPVGDPVFTGLADFDVTITADPAVTVAAAGLINNDGLRRRFVVEQARSFAFLASPDYVRFDDTAAGVPVQVYTTAASQGSGPLVLQTAVDALTLFANEYGPYPYPTLVIAENGYLTSNEYAGFISLGGYLFDIHNGRSDSILAAITAHEVGHQWWYGAVGNDQVRQPWLDESLAMYSELRYYEWYYPDLVDWWWQARVDRWDPAGPVDVTIYDFADSETFVHNMYGRAAYFIRDLRLQMGPAAFTTFLQSYYRQFKFRTATTADFLRLAQSQSPTDLTPLFESYFQEVP